MAAWIELSNEHHSIAQPLFAATHYGVLATGTLEGGHPGRVFVDDLEHPGAGVINTQVGYYFLAGEPTAADLDWLYDAFTTCWVPRQKAENGNPEFLLFFDPLNLGDPLLARFADLRPLRIHKKRHTLLPTALDGLRGWRERMPAGMRLVTYSAELLDANPEMAGEVELLYGSASAFLQNSLGVAILDGETAANNIVPNQITGGNLVSSCTGVFTGGGEVEISIHTAEAYRRRGMAYIAAAAFIEAALERGLAPIWGCWPENAPSMLLAKRLGFIEDCDQPACLWVDSPDWNPGAV